MRRPRLAPSLLPIRFALLPVLVSGLLVGFSAPAAQAQPADTQTPPPRNLIVLIPDGFGPTSQTMAREYLHEIEGRDLVLDRILTGAVRTYASDSRVTDSAASATAYASGVKTYNGAIGLDTTRAPVATLLEAAEARGMATGLVATSRITHATPAAFSAHVPQRSMELEIAAQMLDQGIEVILGGGRPFFLPPDNNTGYPGRRDDGRNLIAEARGRGYTVALDRAGFNAFSAVPLGGDDTAPPVLGLFNDSHLAYEIDRNPQQEPSLAEMTGFALAHLSTDPDGFFLMVEGSRIDHAGHGNDPIGHLHDIIAFDEAVAMALAFAEDRGETLIVVMADHETGGLSLGRNLNGRGIYDWRPDVLARATRSVEGMLDLVEAGAAPDSLMQTHGGVDDLTEEERSALAEAAGGPLGARALFSVMANILSERALVGWTTGGHTAVAVNLHSFGPHAERFAGVMENDAIGRTLADVMGFDLDALTAALRQAARNPEPVGVQN
ncbi:MAG: alkaline phosphatase [Bacteroidota bacterium]